MPDTRKKYEVGKAITGFKPGQPPYVVGPDKTLKYGSKNFTVHVTIDGFAESGKWNRVVKSFHLSFKGLTPQPVGKWAYSSATDSYTFTGWANFDKLGIEPESKSSFVNNVNSFVRNLKTPFGSNGFGVAT